MRQYIAPIVGIVAVFCGNAILGIITLTLVAVVILIKVKMP